MPGEGREPDICLRCGRCCYYGKGNAKPCRNLFAKDGATWCAIYSHRLGAVMGQEHNRTYYCGRRMIDEKRFIEGCPYSKPLASES